MAVVISTKSKISEVLRRLMFEREIRTIDLARQTQLPQPTVQRIVAGTSPNPHLSSLLPIAEFFKISIEQLKGTEPIPWHNFKTAINVGLVKIPIISCEEAAQWSTLKENFQLTAKTKTLITEENLGRHAFALTLPDSSMNPLFPKGTLIIIDPHKIPKDRSYVVVNLKNHSAVIFRQLLIDANKKYLKALSPDLELFPMIALKESDIICGTLVQTRRDFHD